VVARVRELFQQGADVVEIGGESTRPGAQPVSEVEELHRVLPAIRATVREMPDRRIAVDTTKANVARAAMREGASIVNDVSALRLDPAMADVCAEARGTLVLMHSRGGVAEMADYVHAKYHVDGVMDAIISELSCAVDRALQAGVRRDAIVLDPGLGFSKTPQQSVEALAHLPQLLQLGFPVMIGASRKRFIGEFTGTMERPEDRDEGTVGANVAAMMLGASWFRVHEPRANRYALDVAYRVLEGTA
jgi:dihydropteroate synthase